MSKNLSAEVTSNLLNYFQEHIPNFCIDKEKGEALCFRERLDVYSKNNFAVGNTRAIGSYCISVERIGPKNREFLVHVFSSITIDGSLGGSKVVSSATEELHCLEEKRNELVQINDSKFEKKLYINSTGEDSYSVEITKESLCDTQKKSFSIFYKDNYKLISDGCNILLMRYLAVTDFNGTLSLNFITIDGQITICNYECSCARPMEVNGIILDVYVIKQKFYENGNVIHENKNLMTKLGKILSFEWIDSSYIVKINPLLDPIICNRDPIIMQLRETWQEDIEMTSKYIDKKTDEIAEQKQYLLLHTEINDILIDYLQTLLCRKPKDILLFTMNYFKSVICNQISHQSFLNLEPKTNNKDIHYFLINTSQIAKNSICLSGNSTKDKSSASLVSISYSTCSFCSSK